jgi:AraC family transcriptional regulator
MSTIERAVWFIESRLSDPIRLVDVADAVGVSPFHLARLFHAVAGQPVISYVRSRRLSEAARALASGRPDILGLALDVGYGSHEAFTRAFRDRFGLTPEAARAAGATLSLPLTEAFPVTDIQKTDLAEPRIVERPAFLVAGLSMRVGVDELSTIPSLWQRFAPHFGAVPDQVGGDALGVCHAPDETGRFDYLAGVEVERVDDLPPDLVHVLLPAARYAVFRHDAHVTALRHTFTATYDDWLPTSGGRAGGVDFEQYGRSFDPATGMGGLEVWESILP